MMGMCMFLSESKLDESFPPEQFKIEHFRIPFRLDRTSHGGGILLYVREDIPCKTIKIDNAFEAIFIELNFRKQKWLLCSSYNPKLQNIRAHLQSSNNN